MTYPSPVKIAIAPELKRLFGAEVYWTWRLLFTGAGFPWKEVSVDSDDYDILYSMENEKPRHDCFWIQANSHHWQQKGRLKLHRIVKNDQWIYPVYGSEPPIDTLVTRDAGRVHCKRDIVFDVFWLVTGQNENQFPRNKHGHFDLGGTAEFEQNVLQKAVASGLGTALEKILVELGFGNPVPRWPSGTKAAACIGHDVDYPEIIRWLEPFRVVLRQGVKGIGMALPILSGERHHWHFKSWVELEKAFDVRSAFYFVARKGSLLQYATGTPDPFYDVQTPRFRELFHFLTQEGYEIGLHASYLAFQDHEKLALEKQRLSSASRQQILGNRHHYWHLSPDDPESTLLMHEQVGLKYDTSLIHEKYLGWRRGISWPFFPFHQEKRRQLKVLQIPTAWMDDQLFGYKGNQAGAPRLLLKKLIDKTLEHGGCFVADVHDYVYDPKLFPNWAAIYRFVLETLRNNTDFWVATPGEVAEHWITRYQAIIERSEGLTESAARTWERSYLH